MYVRMDEWMKIWMGGYRVGEWTVREQLKEEGTASQQVDTEKEEKQKVWRAYEMIKFLHFLSNTNYHFIK